MAYLNKIMLIGNVGKDPEIRTLAEGNMVAKFTFVTTKKYKDRTCIRGRGGKQSVDYHGRKV